MLKVEGTLFEHQASALRLGIADFRLRAPVGGNAGASLNTRNRPQVLVDGIEVTVRPVAVRGPRHDDERSWGRKVLEISAEPDCLDELIPREAGRATRGIRRQVP